MRAPGSLITPVARITPASLQGEAIEGAQESTISLRIRKSKPPGALDAFSKSSEFWKNYVCFNYVHPATKTSCQLWTLTGTLEAIDISRRRDEDITQACENFANQHMHLTRQFLRPGEDIEG
eukprot:13069196-Heterocapsa_arctica.AAC.1